MRVNVSSSNSARSQVNFADSYAGPRDAEGNGRDGSCGGHGQAAGDERCFVVCKRVANEYKRFKPDSATFFDFTSFVRRQIFHTGNHRSSRTQGNDTTSRSRKILENLRCHQLSRCIIKLIIQDVLQLHSTPASCIRGCRIFPVFVHAHTFSTDKQRLSIQYVFVNTDTLSDYNIDVRLAEARGNTGYDTCFRFTFSTSVPA